MALVCFQLPSELGFSSTDTERGSQCAFFVIALLILFTRVLPAQGSPAEPQRNPHSTLASHPEWPGAKQADVDTIGHIVRAFYSAISAPAGGKLDHNRVRSLFVPEGRVSSRVSGDSAEIRFHSPDEYAAISDAQTATSGFLVVE